MHSGGVFGAAGLDARVDNVRVDSVAPLDIIM